MESVFFEFFASVEEGLRESGQGEKKKEYLHGKIFDVNIIRRASFINKSTICEKSIKFLIVLAINSLVNVVRQLVRHFINSFINFVRLGVFIQFRYMKENMQDAFKLIFTQLKLMVCILLIRLLFFLGLPLFRSFFIHISLNSSLNELLACSSSLVSLNP